MIEVYECHEPIKDEQEQYKIKPLTRGEKIRRTTDKELAELLLEFGYDPCEIRTDMPLMEQCRETTEAGGDITRDMCRRCLTEWLGQQLETIN